MKISKKEEDFRIHVEADNGAYIKSSEILKSEQSPSKRIEFKIFLNKEHSFISDWTREEVKLMYELLKETVKYL